MTDARTDRLIARTWRGTARTADADRYERYITETGMTGSRDTPGNRGFVLLRRDRGAEAEFFTLSLWESMEAIRRFAGDDPSRARFYPEDEAFLIAKDLHADHFEVVAAEVDLPTGRPTP